MGSRKRFRMVVGLLAAVVLTAQGAPAGADEDAPSLLDAVIGGSFSLDLTDRSGRVFVREGK